MGVWVYVCMGVLGVGCMDMCVLGVGCMCSGVGCMCVCVYVCVAVAGDKRVHYLCVCV